MRPSAVLASVLSLIAAAAVVVWLGNGTATVTTTDREEAKPPPPSDLPQPSKEGPHPKAVFPETEFNFGVMTHRAKGSHDFVVKNEGPGVLKVGVEKTSCQCTVGKTGSNEIPPGESTMITLNWEIKSTAPRFEHSATLRTNDPNLAEIILKVKGVVGLKVLSLPQEDWALGFLTETSGGKFDGFIGSSTEKEFEITKLEISDPAIKFEVNPVLEADLPGLRSMLAQDNPDLHQSFSSGTEFIKSGYRVSLMAPARGKQGAFAETMTVETNIPDTTPLQIKITGVRPGPFQIFPTPGVRWYPKELTIDAGEFPASQGKSVSLIVVARGMSGQLEFGEPVCDPKWLKVVSKSETDSSNGHRVKLTFEIPPGSPPVARTVIDPATIELPTNHPDADTLRFRLMFAPSY